MFLLKALQKKETEEVYQMFQEIPEEENGLNNKAYGLTRDEFNLFCQERIRMSLGIGLPEGHVPDTFFILYNDSLPVGFSKLRHYLNEFLLKRGGHIGYAIRPTCRGKGFGKKLLSETLKQAKLMKQDKVLLTISETNISSRKVCEYNGGKLEKIDSGECYYWIDIK